MQVRGDEQEQEQTDPYCVYQADWGELMEGEFQDADV